jgi:hypothetical protein
MWHRVGLFTDVSEEGVASNFRVEKLKRAKVANRLATVRRALIETLERGKGAVGTNEA